jgi:phage FluMu protein Com
MCMAQLFGGIYDIVIVAIIVVVSIVIRIFFLKKKGLMRSKCPKCGAVFDSSRTFGINLGPYRQIKCPNCRKVSFMNIFTKDPVTYPPQEKQQQVTPKLTDEELEKKRIEDSKYEKE